MSQVDYRVLGPLSPGSPSRAQLGLGIEPDGSARPVVLIFAPEEVTADSEAVAALERETARATQLEHPHISRVFGLAHLSQGVARVTEYADGESLRTLLERGGRIPVPIAARLIADMAQGVHYAHLAGNDDGSPLVHGDLRPETVMVAFSGNCKVTGYGALSVAPRERDGRRVVNRRLYCAPEQVVGGRESIIVGTDVFLLGLILYECLSGQRPFSDASDLDQAVLMGQLAPLPNDIPEAFAKIVERCTAKKAAGRYTSALAVREALLEALDGIPLPSDVEVAAWLSPMCPPSELNRASRQQTIDQGIARYAREHWERQKNAPPPRPTPLPPPSAVAPMTEPAPAAAPVPAASAQPPPKRAGRLGPMLMGFGAALMLIGGVAAGYRALQQRQGASPEPTVEPAPEVAEAASAPETGVVPAVADGTTSEVTPASATAPLSGDLIEDPATEEVVEEAEATVGTLSLDTSPRATILSKGRILGRTPLRVELPPGRHAVQITNAAMGLDVVRSFNVTAGKTTASSLVFSRGYVTVEAPRDAEVILDGRTLGKGTQREIGVYEGGHTLTVLANGQRWEQRFNIKAEQRLKFDVGVVE